MKPPSLALRWLYLLLGALAVNGCAVSTGDMESPGDTASESVASALACSKKNRAERVVLCHATDDGARHTITAAAAAVAAHLAHGDFLGECPAGCTSAAACDDSNACTSDDCTADGACIHATVACDDGDPCTVDACDPSVGCATTAVSGGACDDGNDCTASDACVGGACRGSAVAGCCQEDGDCTDDDRCTADRCVQGACKTQPVACAAADACSAGFCDPLTGECATAPVTCDDEDACTVDSCDPSVGCRHDSAPCDGSGDPPGTWSSMLVVTATCGPLSSALLSVPEAETRAFPVSLSRQPPAAVTVSLAVSPSGVATLSRSFITFSTSNWNVPVMVTVLPEADTDGIPETATVTLTSPVTNEARVAVTISEGSPVPDDELSCGDCTPGFVWDGAECFDIDECAGTYGCDPAASCTNLPGGFKCGPCPSGYEGNGAAGCTDLNECARREDDCSDLVACINTPGGFECGDCPTGYTGDGRTCERSWSGTLVVSPSSVMVPADGTGSFTVALSEQPAADVMVTLSITPSDVAVLSRSTITFSTSNWNVPVTVAVLPLPDADAGSETAIVTLGSSVTSSVTVGVVVSDDGSQ